MGTKVAVKELSPEVQAANTCAYCSETIVPSDTTVEAPCHHLLHLQCYHEVFETMPNAGEVVVTCAQCNGPIVHFKQETNASVDCDSCDGHGKKKPHRANGDGGGGYDYDDGSDTDSPPTTEAELAPEEGNLVSQAFAQNHDLVWLQQRRHAATLQDLLNIGLRKTHVMSDQVHAPLVQLAGFKGVSPQTLRSVLGIQVEELQTLVSAQCGEDMDACATLLRKLGFNVQEAEEQVAEEEAALPAAAAAATQQQQQQQQQQDEPEWVAAFEERLRAQYDQQAAAAAVNAAAGAAASSSTANGKPVLRFHEAEVATTNDDDDDDEEDGVYARGSGYEGTDMGTEQELQQQQQQQEEVMPYTEHYGGNYPHNYQHRRGARRGYAHNGDGGGDDDDGYGGYASGGSDEDLAAENANQEQQELTADAPVVYMLRPKERPIAAAAIAAQAVIAGEFRPVPMVLANAPLAITTYSSSAAVKSPDVELLALQQAKRMVGERLRTGDLMTRAQHEQRLTAHQHQQQQQQHGNQNGGGGGGGGASYAQFLKTAARHTALGAV